MDYDLLITNGRILRQATVAAPDLIDRGFVAIQGQHILAVGPMDQIPAESPRAEYIDANGGLVMPGLINSHCHGAMTLWRGLADDLPLMTWLQDHIFPAEARLVNPEMVYWCSKLAAAEMILSGTTTVADGYFFEDNAARAFAKTGLRAVAAQGVIDFPAPGVADPTRNIQAATEFIDHWQGNNPLITPAIFCHSPYTCSPETLTAAKDITRNRQTLFFIHLAETADEIKLLRDRFGRTAIRHLDHLGLLDPETICVHSVWPDSEEIEILADRGASVAICPESNMKLASGVAPFNAMLAAGISIGLGTDGCASNNNLDLFREMDSLAKLAKVNSLDPTILPAGEILGLVTLGGAEILGLRDRIGSLEVGKLADLIILNLRQPHLTPFYNQDLLVYGATGADVTTVLVNGKPVLRDREFVNFDLAEAMTKVRELSRSLGGKGIHARPYRNNGP